MKKHVTNLPPEAILHTPLLNKGTAFTEKERNDLGLNGLLPNGVSTIEQQLERRYENFKSCSKEIDRFSFLSALQNRNEVLFYRFILEHCEEMLPYIYTPTVGDISLDYSNLYVKNRGLFLSYDKREQMDTIIANYPQEVDVIVVTDGSRILGLGDLGVGGMTIPIGKLALYSLFGGIHPGRTLPIILDVGTNNPELLSDPNYLGCRHERIDGDTYYNFIDQFVTAVKKRWPNVLLQWEDFKKPHAQNLLKKYQKSLCSFNDDIQGTASVTLAALLSAIRASKLDIKKQRFAILGAGAAGIGIADLTVAELMRQGLSREEAQKHFFLFNRHGLIHDGMDLDDEHQKRYAQPKEIVSSWDVGDMEAITLLETVQNAKPTVLIGVSGQPGMFTQEIIETMAKQTPRPIIFPLSNPTSRAEAVPQDLFQWTGGRALIGTGSPFKPVEFLGETFDIAQCNNVYIFPGVGLGVLAARAREVTDEMFIRAAEVLSERAPILHDPTKALFPRLKNLREVTREIACAVAQIAVDSGLAQDDIAENIGAAVDKQIWYPAYEPLTR